MSRDPELGATAIEYSLIVAAIAAIIVLVVNVIGQQTKDGFCAGSSSMEAVVNETNPNC